MGGAWSAPPGFGQSRTGARGRSGTCRAARRAARAAQRKRANTYRVSANRKAFFANFRRFTSISGQSTRRRTPKRRDQGRMSRTSLEPAHTEEVLCVTDEAYSAQTAQYQAQRRGIAHLQFLSFFLHMRRGNYGSGHSASASSCKIARF